MCRERCHEDEIAALFETPIEVMTTRDPIEAALALEGNHDGVAFCPVEQFFADPVRLDLLAEADVPPGAATVAAVLSADTSMSLTGGAFLQIVTRDGLRALRAGGTLDAMLAVRVPADPELPEMRLCQHGDLQWAATAAEALLARDPTGSLDRIAQVLADAGLERFSCWDDPDVPPARVLTVRCLPRPLFALLLRLVRRVGASRIDVICGAHLTRETRTLPGVHRIIPFAGRTFSLEELGSETLSAIRAERYDLCVVPRREPTGYGFDNVTPLAVAAGARLGVWLDVFGRSGVLAGQPRPKPSTGPAPEGGHSDEVRRVMEPLELFTPASGSEAGRAGSLDFLLARVDENLACQGVLDCTTSGIDLSGGLLHQLPAAAEVRRRVDQLDADQRPGAASLVAAVDGLFKQFVDVTAAASPGPRPTPIPESIEAAIGRLAAAFSSRLDGDLGEANLRTLAAQAREMRD